MPLMLPNILAIGKAPVNGVDEVQRVTLGGSPTSGVFALTVMGETTADLAYNATAAEAQAAVEALSSIGSGNVTVTGGPLPGAPVVLTFIEQMGGKNLTEASIDGESVTGAAPAVSIATTVGGVAGVLQIETGTITGTIIDAGDAKITVTAAGMPNSPKIVSAAVAALDTASAVGGKVRTALGLDADVSAFFTIGGSGANYSVTAKAKAANDATMNLASDNDTCTGLTAAPMSTHTTAGVASVNEQETVALTGGPTGGTFTLTYSGQTTAGIAYNAAAAAVQSALEALSNIDPGDVAVTGGPLPTLVTITFQGALAATNVTQLTGSAASLTEPTVLVETITQGVRGSARGARVNQVLWDYINGDLYTNTGTIYTPVWSWYAGID